jgi:hypothetical protein
MMALGWRARLPAGDAGLADLLLPQHSFAKTNANGRKPDTCECFSRLRKKYFLRFSSNHSGLKPRLFAPCGTAEAVPFPFLPEHGSLAAQDGAIPVSTGLFSQPKITPMRRYATQNFIYVWTCNAGDVLRIISKSCARSGLSNSATRSLLTCATMICPISVCTSEKMPTLFILWV